MGKTIQLRGKAPLWSEQDGTASFRRYMNEIMATPRTTPEQAMTLAWQVANARAEQWRAILAEPGLLVAALPILRDKDDPTRARAVGLLAELDVLPSLERRARRAYIAGTPRARDTYARKVELVLELIAWTDPDGVLGDAIAKDLGRIARGEPPLELVPQAAARRVYAGGRSLGELAADVARKTAALRAAKNRATKANLRLVIAVAARMSRIGMALEDLVAEGNIGLMKAVNRFDPRKGVRFSTYAVWWIRHTIRRAICDQGRLVRLPVHVVEKLYQVFVTQGVLANRLGRHPDAEEVAAACKLPLEKVQWLLRTGFWTYSLDTPYYSEEDGTEDATRTLGCLVPDKGAPIDELIDESERTELARALVADLDRRRGGVVRARFGMGCPEQTLAEIGEDLGVSRERVRQIEHDALKALRRAARRRTTPDASQAAAVEGPADAPGSRLGRRPFGG
jgi:RNA polymerase primary sigma factor